MTTEPLKMKIISVDDSSIMRRIIRGAVERLGYDFSEATDGFAALHLLENIHPEVSLILMDWNMPNKDGYTTLQELKANPKFQHIPVMMVTTEAEKSNVLKAIQAGASNYLIKPFSNDDLVKKMKASLDVA